MNLLSKDSRIASGQYAKIGDPKQPRIPATHRLLNFINFGHCLNADLLINYTRMSTNKQMDFHFAVDNTEIIVPPSGHLETFGNTLVNYFLVSESMDAINQTRIRTGRMQLLRPQIITPSDYSKMLLEGFGEEAQKYVDWLQENYNDIHILRYGYTLKQEAFSEEIVTSPLEEVLERVLKDAKTRNDPFQAVLRGVDSPWDVCLIKLFWTIVRRSARKNIMDLAQQHLFEKKNGLPYAVHKEVEDAFTAAEKDSSLVKELGLLLQKRNVFPMFEDRFFSLIGRQAKDKRV